MSVNTSIIGDTIHNELTGYSTIYGATKKKHLLSIFDLISVLQIHNYLIFLRLLSGILVELAFTLENITFYYKTFILYERKIFA